jgi:hypothetical protein
MDLALTNLKNAALFIYATIVIALKPDSCFNKVMKTPCIIGLCCILIGCSELPLPTVIEQLRQHIPEAEPGSAVTISFAKKTVIPLPSQQDEILLVR